MKRTINILSSALVLLLAGSCKKHLDLKPLAETSVQQFYKTKYDVDAAMAGMYGAFQQQMVGDAQYKDRYHFWGEYRSDNFERFISYTTNTIDELHFNKLTPDNEFSSWAGLYNVISMANNNIKYIPAVAQLDNRVTQSVVDQDLAESYAMRAMSYFYIIRNWGAAPIWTAPFESLSDNPERPRESVRKILDSVIIKDLEKAYSLTVKAQTPSVWTIGEGAIAAMLADVYMWKVDYPDQDIEKVQPDYTKAIAWISNLFKAKAPTGKVYGGTSETALEPTATWKNLFTNPATSIESIWSINWDYVKNGCACMEISWTANNKQVIVDQDLWNNYFKPYVTTTPGPDIRPRQTLDVWNAYPGTNNRDRFIKWYASPVSPTRSSTATELATFYIQEKPVYLPMYRLADMYLLYAEALNGNGDMANALKYLNYVRKRAGVAQYIATDPLVATKAALENAILQERQFELIGEGKRWYDLVRTSKVKPVMDPIMTRRGNALGFGDIRRIYWPINRTVLNANSRLVQNKGYTD